MSMYRTEWKCCGSVTETESWTPERCPFCAPQAAATPDEHGITPTHRLRFVEREVPMHPFYRTVGPDGEMRQAVQTYRVLQQWWQSVHHPDEGEWRDVPLEEEK